MKSTVRSALLVLMPIALVGHPSAQFPRVRILPGVGSSDWNNFGQQVSVFDRHLGVVALSRLAFYERAPQFSSSTWSLTLDGQNYGLTDAVVVVQDYAFVRTHAAQVVAGPETPVARVFGWDGTTWGVVQTFTLPTVPCSAYGDISATADRFAVSSQCQGTVWVYAKQGQTWSQEGAALQGIATDKFGAAVAVGPDFVAVGAPCANGNAGQVLIYSMSGSNWALSGTLTGSSSDPGDLFGSRLSASGDLLLVSAPNDQHAGPGSPGTAYVFSRFAGAWGEEAQLQTTASGLQLVGVAVHGDVAYVGRTGSGQTPIAQCGADVFRRKGGPWPFFTWEYQYKIWSTDALQPIGSSIATDGATVVLGQPGTTEQTSAVFAFSAPEEPQAYCTAKVNSVGCMPAIGTSGSPRLTGPDDFHVLGSNIINQSPGILFWGPGWNSVPFSGGTLCVLPPLIRTPAQFAGGNSAPPVDCSGTFDFHFSQAYMQSNGLQPGSVVCCQYYSRDNGYTPPDNIGLTNAMFFVVRP